MSRVILIGLFALLGTSLYACDSASDDGAGNDAAATSSDTGAAGDAAIGPGDPPAGPLLPQPDASCIGMTDTNAIPQGLHDYCAAEMTQAVLAGGDICFSVEKPADPKGPYCAFCAVKGGTQKLCIMQVVP